MRVLTSGLAMVAALLAFSDGGSLPRYKVTATGSLPTGIYEQTKEPLDYGTIVVFCLSEEHGKLGLERGWLDIGTCPGGAGSVMKKIVGMPGNTITLAWDFVAVNGIPIPHSPTQKKDRLGRDLPSVERGVFTLQEDEYFVLGDNSPDSWDSKYTGIVKRSQIRRTYKPFFVFARRG